MKIILHRPNRYERFGLTLSYEYQSSNQLKIYIEKIDENSVADLNGNVQCGDEIIRINNHSFSNRDQAIQLIYQYSYVILQVIPSKVCNPFLLFYLKRIFSKFVNRRYSPIESMVTEDDSGIILACQTDFERIDQVLFEFIQNEKKIFLFE